MTGVITATVCFALSAFNVAMAVHHPTHPLFWAGAVFLFGLGIINSKLIR